MNISLLRMVISRYMSLNPNDDFGIEKCWNELTDIFSEDISATINFFENDCTDEEFYWLGAIFEDIAEKTQSEKFVSMLYIRLSKVYPDNYNQQSFKSEYMRNNVDYKEYVRCLKSDISCAEGRIDK